MITTGIFHAAVKPHQEMATAGRTASYRSAGRFGAKTEFMGMQP